MMPSPILKRPVSLLLTILFATSFFFSCDKELSSENGGNALAPDLTTQVSSSVSGFVTDEYDQPVPNATVKIGSVTITTNKFGFYEARNVMVVKNAATVSVVKPGYFKAVRTFITSTGKHNFLRIKLIPKIISGYIDATTGGSVTLANGLIVSLPDNAVVVASTGLAYTGTISVAAHWISPATNDMHTKMPGDLRGLDQTGALKILETYGMAAVELMSSSGELLQVATGKKATLTIPLPASLSSSAPSSIPLWYFDETIGLWKEEGSATKTGIGYVGQVSHFSYWNCDVPSAFVQFNCTVTDAVGLPVKNALVKISRVGNPNAAGYGFTDSSGYTGGSIPANAQLKLEIFSEYGCGTPAYTQNFTTTTANVSLGQITVSAIHIASLNGTVTNCSANPVTNGYVIIERGNNFYRQPISAAGNFNLNLVLCSTNDVVNIIGVDNGTLQQSPSLTYTLVTGNNSIGNISACGTSIQQFLNYTVNGSSYSFSIPSDSLYSFLNLQSPPVASYQVSAFRIGGSAANNYASMSFTQPNIGINSVQSLVSFGGSDISDSLSITTPINVNITEFGSVGQFMSGNFSGVMTGKPPANTLYNISGSFRVRRQQ